MSLKVEIWSDVVCPWCYVGKRRFEEALARFEHRDEVELVRSPTRRRRSSGAGHRLVRARAAHPRDSRRLRALLRG